MDVSGRVLTDRAGGLRPEPLRVSAKGAHPSRELYRLLDLFSGIGGFSLGLERTGGFKTIAFAETGAYPSRVLARHWPDVRNVGDVTTAEYPDADAIAAGFPCQDLSNAGKRAGIAGERSGLWREVVRAVRVVRPRFVLLENVAALLGRGLGKVLGDLASHGYDTEWDCIPASHVGAPHGRDRWWAVAYPERGERGQEPYLRSLGRMGREQQSVPWDRDWQGALREFRGMDDGSAYRVDRVDTLRNGLVPQIPEMIGHAILRDRDASLAEDAKRLSPEGVAARAAEGGIAQPSSPQPSGAHK